jgi:hypothetical protein
MPTSAALPATITPQSCARRHTQHSTTSAPWHVSPNTAHTNKPHTAHRTLTRSIQRTSPVRPHDVPHSCNHCALHQHHCMHTAARMPHTVRHTAPTTPHTTHRKSHPVTHAASAPHSLQSCQAAQRRRDAAGELVSAPVQPPAGHTNSHRVTPWHPTPPPTPASRPQRIAAPRIASIKYSQVKASQHTACYRSRATPYASDLKKRYNQTAHRYLTPSSHSTSQRHRDGRVRHNATLSDAMHVQTSARHITTATQQRHTASECRE